MRCLLLLLACAALPAQAQAPFQDDIGQSAEHLRLVYGEPDRLTSSENSPLDLWYYRESDGSEIVSRSFFVRDDEVVGGGFTAQYADEAAAYRQVAILTDALTADGFTIAPRDGGIHSVQAIGENAFALIRMARTPIGPETSGYAVRLMMQTVDSIRTERADEG